MLDCGTTHGRVCDWPYVLNHWPYLFVDWLASRSSGACWIHVCLLFLVSMLALLHVLMMQRAGPIATVQYKMLFNKLTVI